MRELGIQVTGLGAQSPVACENICHFRWRPRRLQEVRGRILARGGKGQDTRRLVEPVEFA
jgi:hypothetical protein